MYLSLPNSGQDTAGWLNSQTVLEKYKRRQYNEYKIHKRTKIRTSVQENVYFFTILRWFRRRFVHRFGQQREPSGLYAVLGSFSATHRK